MASRWQKYDFILIKKNGFFFGGKDAPSREISQLPVRFAGVGVPNPVSAADGNFELSASMTADVSASLKAGSELDAIGYGLDSKRVLRLAKKAREAELAAKLELLKASGRPPDARRMVRSQTTGAWLTATPSSDFGTALSSTEFRDSLRIRHGLTPLGLASHCDACPQARFTVGHALQCKIGGLIRARHEAVAAEWHQLCAAALTHSAVTYEPEIPIVHTATDGGALSTILALCEVMFQPTASGLVERRQSLTFGSQILIQPRIGVRLL